jgi:DNA polymerase-2
MLNLLSKATDARQLPDYLPDTFKIFAHALDELNSDRVPLESLVLTNRISRDLELYKSPTAAVRAALQLFEQTGKRTGPGQKIRYLYTKNDVYAWDCPGTLSPDQIDKSKYREMLARAAGTVFYPFGIDSKQLLAYAHKSLQFELSLMK